MRVTIKFFGRETCIPCGQRSFAAAIVLETNMLLRDFPLTELYDFPPMSFSIKIVKHLRSRFAWCMRRLDDGSIAKRSRILNHLITDTLRLSHARSVARYYRKAYGSCLHAVLPSTFIVLPRYALSRFASKLTRTKSQFISIFSTASLKRTQT